LKKAKTFPPRNAEDTELRRKKNLATLGGFGEVRRINCFCLVAAVGLRPWPAWNIGRAGAFALGILPSSTYSKWRYNRFALFQNRHNPNFRRKSPGLSRVAFVYWIIPATGAIYQQKA
jgi:hypothetical protein